MSLNKVSDTTISSIFGQLNRSESACLLKTSYRFNKIAVDIGKLKREAFELRLIVDRRKKSDAAVTVSIVWNAPKYRLYYIMNGMQLWPYEDSSDEYPPLEKRVFIRRQITSNTTEENILEMVEEMLKDVLPKVAKFSVLTITSLKINSNLIGLLKNAGCGLEALLIAGHYTPNAADLLNALRTFNPKNVIMEDRNNVVLNDVHIALVPMRFILIDDSEIRYYQDIGDQTLINWIYRMPVTIDFELAKTSITLEGVIKFIKGIVKKFSSIQGDITGREFNLGVIRFDEKMCSSYLRLLQTRNLDFKIDPVDGHTVSAWKAAIPIVTFKHITIKFANLKSPSRITKEQARNKLLNIRLKWIENEAEDPLYNFWMDEELIAQKFELEDQMFEEWDELITMIQVFGQDVAPENIDEESDDEELSDDEN